LTLCFPNSPFRLPDSSLPCAVWLVVLPSIQRIELHLFFPFTFSCLQDLNRGLGRPPCWLFHGGSGFFSVSCCYPRAHPLIDGFPFPFCASLYFRPGPCLHVFRVTNAFGSSFRFFFLSAGLWGRTAIFFFWLLPLAGWFFVLGWVDNLFLPCYLPVFLTPFGAPLSWRGFSSDGRNDGS